MTTILALWFCSMGYCCSCTPTPLLVRLFGFWFLVFGLVVCILCAVAHTLQRRSVYTGDIDFGNYSNVCTSSTCAAEGMSFLDICGTGARRGGLRQTIGVSAGASYRLSLQYTAHPGGRGCDPGFHASNSADTDISINGVTHTLSHAGATSFSSVGMGWTPWSMDFVANSTTVTLQMESRAAECGCMFIDAVEIQRLQCPQTRAPTRAPTRPPTRSPTRPPTRSPTQVPTGPPTQLPTRPPTHSPTRPPTQTPTQTPTRPPTRSPTQVPTQTPTRSPTQEPTTFPTQAPSGVPTAVPTSAAPTAGPTDTPTTSPTAPPSLAPSYSPTVTPSDVPTDVPTSHPSLVPTSIPTAASVLGGALTTTATPAAVATASESNGSGDSWGLITGVVAAVLVCFVLVVVAYARKRNDSTEKLVLAAASDARSGTVANPMYATVHASGTVTNPTYEALHVHGMCRGKGWVGVGVYR
eukprot:m.75074 g.75074  ORF g.75074 m.75074 type:complete len:467 (+) comp16165_c0_seq11:1365-2765(+)